MPALIRCVEAPREWCSIQFAGSNKSNRQCRTSGRVASNPASDAGRYDMTMRLTQCWGAPIIPASTARAVPGMHGIWAAIWSAEHTKRLPLPARFARVTLWPDDCGLHVAFSQRLYMHM